MSASGPRGGAGLARRTARRLPLLGCVLGFGLACDAGGGPSAPAQDPLDPASEAARIERLSAIGYLAGGERAPRESGVTRHDRGRVAEGLNLLTSGHGPVALLMDLDGEVVHEWRAEFAAVFPDQAGVEGETPRRNFWRDALLLPDGSLLVIWELFGLFQLDRDSRVRWAVSAPAHHALQRTERGEIVHLQAERRPIAGIPHRKAIEDLIVTRDAAGRELRRLAISEALRNARWPTLRKRFWVRARERGYGLDERSASDPFHTNALWLLRPDEAERLGDPFRPGDALVSMAMLDTVAILDLERGVTRWSQQGPFGMQHEPRVGHAGEIVLFNNFRTAERSSVMALDPRTRRVVWEHAGPESDPLHSRRSGRVQVLPNGNLLVVETDRGRALELSAEGEVVWEFRSPHRAPGSPDRVAGLYSLERVTGDALGWLGPERPAEARGR